MGRRVCLSVGAGPDRGLPSHYQGFDVVTLDVDASTRPDIVADVRDLSAIATESYDAVFMSHLLEHFARWEVPVVLAEVHRVLRHGGFVEIRVPHARAVFEALVDGHDLDTPLYHSAMGPIDALDVLFGHSESLRRGKEFMAHRMAFTPELLEACLRGAGLRVELCQTTGGKRFELSAFARKVEERAVAREQRQAEEQVDQASSALTMYVPSIS